jgi:hypothetical protein
MKFFLIAGGLALGTLMMLASCSRPAEVRYKVSVELEENGKVRTGSSVWQWRISRPTLALASPYDTEFHGEAVHIPLDQHPDVFALLMNSEADSHYAPMLVERRFGLGWRNAGKAGRSYDRVKDVRDIASRVGERVELDCRDPRACPMLVWFERPDDPTSVRMADPARLPRLDDSGITLRRITVEITRDELTRSMAKTIPWLRPVGKERSRLIPSPRIRPGEGKKKPVLTPLQQVNVRAFSTELFR